jgi:hypothetical protein
MPESEPKPRPLETVAPGSGQGWKAVLKNGRQVVVHEIPVAPAAAAAAVPRIQRLAEHPHPSLSPILAWGTDAGGLWIAVEPNEGTPLSTVLGRGRFTPHAAAALGTAILSGIAALHEAGVAMGGFDATAIRLTGNGAVRLAGHPVAAVRGAPSQGDLRADVRSCGMAICAAFGVDPAGKPAPPDLAPGLVVTMRSMASGAMGPAVDRAQGALREMAGPLLAPDRQLAAQSEIALRAGGREMPPTPFVPEAPKTLVEDTPVPRAASYEPPPRAADTYSSIPASPPRPVETWGPAAATPVPEPASPASPVETWGPAAAAPVPEAASPPRPAETWGPAAAPSVPEADIPAAEPEPAPAPAPPPLVTPAHEMEPPGPPSWDAQPAAPAAEPTPEPVPEPAPEAEPAPWTAPAAAEAPAARPAPAEPAATPTWTPLETGQWTPGPAPAGRVSSSEWTGEATPIPAPVPQEFLTPRSAPASTAPPVTTPPVTPPPLPRAAAPAPVRKPASRRPSIDILSERPAWLIPAAIAVVVLLVIGTVGVIFLNRGKGGHLASSSPSPTRSSPKPTSSPTGVALLPIPNYGPTVNPPLTSVKFCTPSAPCVFGGGVAPATDTNCTLSGPCHIDMAATWSGNTVNTLTFSIEFFERCNNPGGTSTTVLQRTYQNVGRFRPTYDPAPAGGFAVSLPSGAKAAALVVIADTGTVKAASAPLLLGADSCA